ncbi:DUF323 domain-containing protein [Guyanagaster necrorhizus]|uniref:DUF323 domain-containing protein n=1 Tax=Guyanagaster necrorhizus TaxID=856835 RepID=A0A9P7VS27_9AGAR|nr:DUF323 domain-containing protein [Guyanagaster necrorhizus MCA 3950]KAG7445802.1 DUF323 domain-containing protein [Guyanagaster necrorhizus MCA 3950]
MPSSKIVNVHSQAANVQAIRQAVVDGLDRPAGQKQLPTLLLYDERGLRLYDDITTKVPEYYLFAAEEEILKTKADDIVRIMHGGGGGDIRPDEAVLELGSGALRKTSHILRGLAKLVQDGCPPASRPPITYYALDLEERELERTLGEIAESDVGMLLQGKVETKGMWGTYDNGLKYVEAGGLRSFPSHTSVMDSRFSPDLKLDARDISPNSSVSYDSSATDYMHSDSPPSTPDDTQPPLHLLFLGSSLGNFSRRAGTDFLRSLPLRPGSGDTLLLGLDHDNSKQVIEEAYNDRMGYTRKFIMNGLRRAGKVLGNEHMFDHGKWSYVNNYNESERRHEAFFKCTVEHTVSDPATTAEFLFLKDELVKIEESFKFSDRDAYTLFIESNLRPIQRWSDSPLRYSLWLLERPSFIFPLLSSPGSEATSIGRKQCSTPFGVPSPQDWQYLWQSWDVITRKMIPPSMLYQKPIDLRHICLFYLGHIPTFLDIHLSRLLEEPHTEPDGFKYIFERGIDPIVDDPSVCHPHSQVPTEDKDWPTLNSILLFQDRVRARLLSLYQDVEAGKQVLTRKMGRVLFMTYEHEALHAETLLYMLLQRAGTGTLPPPGFAAPDWESLSEKWAAESKPSSPTITLGPATVTLGHDDVEAEDAQASDVATHEYGWDNEHPKRQVHVNEFRIEWRPVTNGEFYEFYMSGHGKDVQVPASWVQVAGAMQVRTLYGPVPMNVAYSWPVIASYKDLSRYALVKGGRLPTEPELRLFYDKFEAGYEGGANVGFRNWHPIPATTGGERDGGRGSNGGVWEWTSTLFEKYDGFVPSALYPGYSMDFFDGAHQVVLGGSYATIPRIASRRSVRNWYQRNYPYPWVGGRVVYEL